MAQIRGGISTEETQTETVTETATARAEAAVAAALERRRELGVSRVVTATTAADFLNLLDKLQDPRLQRPIRVGQVDARPDASTPDEAGELFRDELLQLREGDFVVIRNVRVLMPVHIRPYDAITRLGADSFTSDAAERREIEVYAETIGPDPKVVFNVGAHPVTDDGAPLAGTLPDGRVRPGCPVSGWLRAFKQRWPTQERPNARVLLPVRYGLLAPESSLLSGGDSIVVGKVIRVLREPNPPERKPRASDVCYSDEQARDAFGLTTDRIPDVVVNSLSGINLGNIEESLATYARVRAPAAVVLPVAIYR